CYRRLHLHPRPLVRSVQLFFFSSRRRHTRFKCDWSSDVCSSDLERRLEPTGPQPAAAQPLRRELVHFPEERLGLEVGSAEDFQRSEERRVGKEGRSRWSPDAATKRKATRRGTETTDVGKGSRQSG